ncbi:DsrE/DsrF-like family protein [Roseimaritima multifibrata]|uniref:DsrE/DsrF-like family protein n=1 Tax=Roseimaritima multifibrata TaxID=1930274 RepID=A0A517MIE2_9BACT|nr:DsrE family protein [Roseimaritima multifibrata]QDS94557.1 DsrE/DsrF-like family protein [Roseimaritima multifibrata]
MNRSRFPAFVLMLVISLPMTLSAQQGNGPGFHGGRGPGGGQGQGRGQGGRGAQQNAQHQGQAHGHGHDDRHAKDRELFQFLLQNHDKIKRNVKQLPNGVETLTESDVPEIAAKIQEHVEWMTHRIENANPIRMRDPLFAEIFKNTKKIRMVHEDTEKGVRVTETSDDPYVAKLIQAHAKVVSEFVKNGFAEAMKNHPVPKDQPTKPHQTAHPVIQGHGPVVHLPGAAQQPKTGTKILVDLTRGSNPKQLNAGLEKVAKYVNIYAGAGADPADVKIAVVFHGDATLAVLNPDAYSEEFNTTENPNLALLHELHESNVELYVCGQSLISKGADPKDVAVFVKTAVSALTTVVNHQADGYAYVPLGK